MQAMTPTLSSQNIAAYCRPAAQQVRIAVVAETGSTNADLLAQVDAMTTPTLLIAKSQTAGRGRAGRVWHSAPDASLTFSLAWKFNLPLQALVGLSLAVGVALAEALGELDVAVQLKWPNDLLQQGEKLAGILIETAMSKGGAWAVIGVGLNLAMPEQVAAQIGRPAAHAPGLAEMDRNRVMATLLNHLAQALTQFEQQGFAAFMSRWNALHAYAGRQVNIQDRDQILQQGTAVGVDAAGCLLLDTAGGRIAVMAGDVSLRLQEG